MVFLVAHLVAEVLRRIAKQGQRRSTSFVLIPDDVHGAPSAHGTRTVTKGGGPSSNVATAAAEVTDCTDETRRPKECAKSHHHEVERHEEQHDCIVGERSGPVSAS